MAKNRCARKGGQEDTSWSKKEKRRQSKTERIGPYKDNQEVPLTILAFKRKEACHESRKKNKQKEEEEKRF